MSSLFDRPKHYPDHLPCPHEKLNTSYLSKRRRGSIAVVTLVTLVVVIAAATAASALQLRLGHQCRSLGTDAALRPFFFAFTVRALLRIVFRVVNCRGHDSMVLNDAAAAAAAAVSAAASAPAFCRLGWSQCLSGVAGWRHRALH